MTSRDGGEEPMDPEFEADLEFTLHDAVDEITSSPDLRTTVEHAAAQDFGFVGPSAFAEAETASPSPEVRVRVAAAIASLATPAPVSWWRQRRWAVLVAAAVVVATMLLGALASALPGLGGPAGQARPERIDASLFSDECVVPWSVDDAGAVVDD